MRSAAAAVLMLAGVAACSGYTPGTTGLGDAGPPISNGPGDAGDAGPGDGGDAGPDGGPDAGCGPLTLNGVPAIDGCSGTVLTSATGTVNTANCTLVFNLADPTGTCSGLVSGGTANAFDGGCQGSLYTCTSASLPGTLHCVYGTSTCTIQICDAGASCP